MKSYTTLIFFILFTILFPQNRVEDIKNKRLIDNIAYYQNETTPFSGKFISENFEEEYAEGIREGYFKGNITIDSEVYICEGRFDNGLKNGEWIIKTPQNQLKAILKYSYDRPAGIWKYFNSNNIIIGTEQFIDGELQGEVNLFYNSGLPKITMNFEEGLLHKNFIAYHTNGKVSTLTNFEQGKLDGELKLFSTQGVLLVDGLYNFNKREGEWKFYYNSGELKSIINYKDGKREGENTIYGKGGEILQQLFFNNDIEIEGGEEYKNFGDKILNGFKKFSDELEYKKYDKILDEI